jgi:hypothetical protein
MGNTHRGILCGCVLLDNGHLKKPLVIQTDGALNGTPNSSNIKAKRHSVFQTQVCRIWNKGLNLFPPFNSHPWHVQLDQNSKIRHICNRACTQKRTQCVCLEIVFWLQPSSLSANASTSTQFVARTGSNRRHGGTDLTLTCWSDTEKWGRRTHVFGDVISRKVIGEKYVKTLLFLGSERGIKI